MGKKQRCHFFICHRGAAQGNIIQGVRGCDIKPCVAFQIRLVIDTVLPRFLRRSFCNLVDTIVQNGEVDQVGANGQGRAFNLLRVNMYR